MHQKTFVCFEGRLLDRAAFLAVLPQLEDRRAAQGGCQRAAGHLFLAYPEHACRSLIQQLYLPFLVNDHHAIRHGLQYRR